MSRKVQKISVLMVIIVFLLIVMRANTLLANYPIVPDLTIESTQGEGRVNESFQLKIVDAHTLDSKVWFPLPTNVSFTGSQNEHGSVTYDAENHQLVIDWNNQEEENRFVTIELTASEAGSYEFQASVMREEKTVASQPVVINIEEDTENPQEEEVEVPVENEQPEVVEEDQQEGLNTEIQQETENIEQPMLEKEQVEEIIGTVDDPRFGLPIKDIFPDPNMANAVAISMKKNVNDPLLYKNTPRFLMLESQNITDVTGIDIFSERCVYYYLGNNNIKELPPNFFIAMRNTSVTLMDLSYNLLEKLPHYARPDPNLSMGDRQILYNYNLSHNRLTTLNNDCNLLALRTFHLNDNFLTNIPNNFYEIFIGGGGLSSDEWTITLKNNLLQEDDELFNQKTSEMANGTANILKFEYGPQQQLNFNSELPIDTIRKSNELENETLLEKFRPYIEKANEPIPDGLPLNLLDFVNKDGEVIDITTYFKDGKVIKNEDIYVKVQSRTDGIYDVDQNSNSITSNQAQLVLKTFGNLSFVQAPSQLSFGEDLKITATNQVFPLQSFDRPLSIQDDKAEKSTWRMTAKMTKELTSPSNRVLENSLHYRLNGEDKVLNKTELNIYTQQNSNDEPFNISDTWVRDEQNGLFLEIKAGQALAEEYSGTIEWKLQDVPIN